MEVILMSIKPKHAKNIIFGSKTIELRRVAPNLNKAEVILIYESSPVKAITGYAFIVSITESSPDKVWDSFASEVQISKEDFDAYYVGAESAFAIHITNATRFDNPISLDDLRNENILSNPPQSYRYLQFKKLKKSFNVEIPCLG